jgi:3-dehydroquinate dehydratase II
MSRRIFILNGPNLNMLGTREPELYGTTTLPAIEEMCHKKARELGLSCDCRQSNHEGEMISWIQQARGKYGGIVINAGAYSHTSIAIYDALKIAELPVVEVHMTNIKEREPFRHGSFIELMAAKTIMGLGAEGYIQALDFLAARLGSQQGMV